MGSAEDSSAHGRTATGKALGANYLQADETVVPVQMHDKTRQPIIRRTCGNTVEPGGETVFDFRLGRGREGPKKFFGHWEGILQTDGYRLTIAWAGRSLCMWAAGRTRGASLSMR